MNRNHQTPRRVLIVGAGPGGLATAMLMARAGAEVTVLERLDRVGGRTATFLGEGGFRFDIGPTFFLYPRILEEIFRDCGTRLADEVELTRLDPQYHLRFEGGESLMATADPQRMKQQIAAIAPADADGFERFMADNRRKFAAFGPILQRPFNSVLDLLHPSMLKAAWHVRPWASVEGDLKRYFSDPRVRLAFSFQAKYLGMSPFQCPSLFTILSFLEYEHGVFHPTGGCGAVMEAMARVARRMGVRFHLGEPVEQLMFQGRRCIGARTAAGTYRADAIVVNADFAHAMKHLVPDRLRRRWTDRRIESKRFSCSTFMLYLGIDGLERDLAHHTIFLSGDYRENIADIEQHHRLSENPSFYVQNACVTDPSLAPPGCSTLYVLAPVSHQHPNIDWQREAPRYRALMLRRLRALGIEDIERRLRFEKVYTPADWQGQMAIHRGATFNLAHTLGQMLHRRPHNRFEDLDGVYLVGGGTHPGSGLPVIFESARMSSRLICEDIDLHPYPGGVGRNVATAPAVPAASTAQTTGADMHVPAT